MPGTTVVPIPMHTCTIKLNHLNQIEPLSHEHIIRLRGPQAPRSNAASLLNHPSTTKSEPSGETIVPFQYDRLYDFDSGYAMGKRDGQYFYIDRTGKEVFQSLDSK